MEHGLRHSRLPAFQFKIMKTGEDQQKKYQTCGTVISTGDNKCNILK